MLGMTAFIQKRFVGFFAGEDCDENFTLVVLTEVATCTTLSVMNRLHRGTSLFFCLDSADGHAVVSRRKVHDAQSRANYDSMGRRVEARATDSVAYPRALRSREPSRWCIRRRAFHSDGERGWCRWMVRRG